MRAIFYIIVRLWRTVKNKTIKRGEGFLNSISTHPPKNMEAAPPLLGEWSPLGGDSPISSSSIKSLQSLVIFYLFLYRLPLRGYSAFRPRLYYLYPFCFPPLARSRELAAQLIPMARPVFLNH